MLPAGWYPNLQRMFSMSLVRIPSEVSLDWVYLPPFLLTVTYGYLAAFAISKLLNASGLSRIFWNPGLVFVSLWVLLTALIGLFFISP